jgi:hypothetical protein
VAVDYAGPHVNAATFLAVLTGDADGVAAATARTAAAHHQASAAAGAVRPPLPPPSGRVLNSLTRADRLLLFYADHGGPGLLGMPAGPPLYGDQRVAALRTGVGAGEVVAVVEACDAGSSFEGLLLPARGGDGAGNATRVWVMTEFLRRG